MPGMFPGIDFCQRAEAVLGMTHGAEVRLGCHVQNLDVDKGKNDDESDGQQSDQQEMSFTPVEEIFDRHSKSPFERNFPGGGVAAGMNSAELGKQFGKIHKHPD
jgi:hypothetical protein